MKSMADTNLKPEWSQGESPHELDRMLNTGLASYAAVEPRAGLNDRILANLRMQQAQPPSRWWQWSLAAGLAAVIAVTITLWWRVQTPVPPVVSRPTVTKPYGVNSMPQLARQGSGPLEPEKSRRTGQGHRIAPVLAAEPKLDQFPSPQPLSPEEIALARYVQNFPKEAQLVARAQEEFALESQKELNVGSQTGTSHPIEQER